MTNEEIFEVASNYLRYFEDGWRGTEYSGKPEDLLKFAIAIHKDGYNKGYSEGYKSGSTGVFGEPLG